MRFIKEASLNLASTQDVKAGSTDKPTDTASNYWENIHIPCETVWRLEIVPKDPRPKDYDDAQPSEAPV